MKTNPAIPEVAPIEPVSQPPAIDSRPTRDAEEIEAIIRSKIDMANATPADWIWETLAVLEAKAASPASNPPQESQPTHEIWEAVRRNPHIPEDQVWQVIVSNWSLNTGSKMVHNWLPESRAKLMAESHNFYLSQLTAKPSEPSNPPLVTESEDGNKVSHPDHIVLQPEMVTESEREKVLKVWPNASANLVHGIGWRVITTYLDIWNSETLAQGHKDETSAWLEAASKLSEASPVPKIDAVQGEGEMVQVVPVMSREELTCEHKDWSILISHGNKLCCYVCHLEDSLDAAETAQPSTESFEGKCRPFSPVPDVWQIYPDSQGYWWHHDGNPEVRPFMYHIQVSCSGPERYFIDFPDSRWCDEVGGLWSKAVEPAIRTLKRTI